MSLHRRERVAASLVLGVAATAGVIAATGVVQAPGVLCITPYGTATIASGCDPGHVSAALGIVAGALTAAVTAVFGLAVAAAVLALHARGRLSGCVPSSPSPSATDASRHDS